jgi:hypothetical protein
VPWLTFYDESYTASIKGCVVACSNEASDRPDEESRLLEARRTYATGLLAIALTRTEVCDEAVRSGTVAQMVQVSLFPPL